VRHGKLDPIPYAVSPESQKICLVHVISKCPLAVFIIVRTVFFNQGTAAHGICQWHPRVPPDNQWPVKTNTATCGGSPQRSCCCMLERASPKQQVK